MGTAAFPAQAWAFVEIWEHAALAQERRTSKAVGSRSPLTPKGKQVSLTELHAEAHQLIIAAHQLYRAVETLKPHTDVAVQKAIKLALKVFKSDQPSLMDMRGILTHFDRYASGRGNKQAGVSGPLFSLPSSTRAVLKTSGQHVGDMTIKVLISPGSAPLKINTKALGDSVRKLMAKVRNAA